MYNMEASMASDRPKQTINEINHRLTEYDEHLLILREERNKIITDVFNIYIEKDTQEKFISDLEQTCFSQSKTDIIKQVFQNYNTDVININVVRTIVEGEKHILEHSKEEGFFSKIANAFLFED